MQKLMILFILSVFVFVSCAPSVADKYERERNYNRAQQQADKNFNELDRQQP